MPALTTHVPPHKVRFHHILHDVQILLQTSSPEAKDFKAVQAFLAQHYGISEDGLLKQGMRRAYRQIVEGL